MEKGKQVSHHHSVDYDNPYDMDEDGRDKEDKDKEGKEDKEDQDEEGKDNADEEDPDILQDEMTKDDWKMHPGPLTAAQKVQCQEFGVKVMAHAQALAKQLNKLTCNILLQSRLLTQSEQSPTLANE